MMFYDRKAQPMTREDWEATLGDNDYRAVAQHWVRGWMVSTVWLGLDHGFSMGRHAPLIFETMVFPPGDEADGQGVWSSQYCERYPTEEAAQAGHDRALAAIVEKLGPDSVADITGPLMETDLSDEEG